ncbi:MAG: flavin reductase family protein, partial [Clostridia bacterium]
SFSLSFFDESYKEKLSYCGKFSSKNVDKFEQCGFDIEIENQIPYIKQAELVFCCKKLFKQQFSPQSFIDKDLLSNYPQEDYHFLYVGEIEAALIK